MFGIEFGREVRLNAAYSPHRWLAYAVSEPNGAHDLHVSASTDESNPHTWVFEESGVGGHVYLRLASEPVRYLRYGPNNPPVGAKLYVGPRADDALFRYELRNIAGHDMIVLEGRGPNLDGFVAYAASEWHQHWWEGTMFMVNRRRGVLERGYSDRHFVSRSMFRIIGSTRSWSDPAEGHANPVGDEPVEIAFLHNPYGQNWLAVNDIVHYTVGRAPGDFPEHGWRLERGRAAGTVTLELSNSVDVGQGRPVPGPGWYLRYEHYPSGDPHLRLLARDLLDRQSEFRYEAKAIAGCTAIVLECGELGAGRDGRFLRWREQTFMEERPTGPLQYPYEQLMFHSQSVLLA